MLPGMMPMGGMVPGMMSPYAGMMGGGMMGSPGPQVTGSPESPKPSEKADAAPTDGKKRWMAFCKDHGISTEEDRDAFDSWRRNHTIEHMALFLRERNLAKKAAAGGGGGAAGGGDDDDLQDEDEDEEDEAPTTSMKKKKTSGSLLAGILASQQGGKVAKAAKAMKVMKATKAMKGMKANTLSADVKKAITKLLKIHLSATTKEDAGEEILKKAKLTVPMVRSAARAAKLGSSYTGATKMTSKRGFVNALLKKLQ